MDRIADIVLSHLDLDRLESLLASLPQQAVPGRAAWRAQPDRADVVAPDQIALLASIGSALPGLSTGNHIAWRSPGGHPLKVRIVKIVYQPERAGALHR
jgi:regulator of nucleoside diphosphate kinase